jgi:phosphotransferase system HPr (HPr) family protein
MSQLCSRVELQGALGLHARRAALVVAAAAGFAADITVSMSGRRANAKSLISLLTLGASQGVELVVMAEGHDAHEALRAVERLLITDTDRWN